jgi:putative CocE/NonD family hydrolase
MRIKRVYSFRNHIAAARILNWVLVMSGMPAAARARYENYYVVTQNIRGRFQSEGKVVMGRPPHDPVEMRRLYFREGRRLSFDAPPGDGGFDEYVSDPENPVPYRPRPVPPTYPGPEWKVWLVQDQRFVDRRPDVLSWQTEPLSADMRVAGDLAADLFASTSGTDSDWVVKLIDVYPENTPDDAETKTRMAGFQLIVADEILRARFRNGFERPEAVPAGKVLEYHIDLHTNAHAFLKGHRVMVQVQSTWFPVYDRNPQKFVANIFEAHAADYVKATQRIHRAARTASAIVLPVVK